jgi:hypothetical protein
MVVAGRQELLAEFSADLRNEPTGNLRTAFG